MFTYLYYNTFFMTNKFFYKIIVIVLELFIIGFCLYDSD